MAEVVLTAETGRTKGSRATRRLRREGKIPGVIYGHGTDPLPVAVGARELRVALNGEAGANQLLSLETGSGTFLTRWLPPRFRTAGSIDARRLRRCPLCGARRERVFRWDRGRRECCQSNRP